MALLGALFVDLGRHLPARRARRDRRSSTPRSSRSARVLASVIGTTGASALLIRPLLRANAQRRAHAGTSSSSSSSSSRTAAGLLTPLGDPPLFLGFLRGVPVHLDAAASRAPWAVVNGALLVVFALARPRLSARREPPSRSGAGRGRAASRCARGRAEPGVAARRRRDRVRRRHLRRARSAARRRARGADRRAWSGSRRCRSRPRRAGSTRPTASPGRRSTRSRSSSSASSSRWCRRSSFLAGARRQPRHHAARGSSSGRRGRCRACSTTRRPT